MRVIPNRCELVDAPHIGPAGCGKVVPFTIKRRTAVALQSSEMYHPETYVACGDSMTGRGIHDGDTLICRTEFRLEETYNRVCVVLVNQEYVAKIVVPNYDGTVTLKSANHLYSDKTFDGDDIEVVGIVKKIQRDIE